MVQHIAESETFANSIVTSLKDSSSKEKTSENYIFVKKKILLGKIDTLLNMQNPNRTPLIICRIFHPTES